MESRRVVDELQRAVGRIEGKLDQLIAANGKQDDRITAVEKKVWYASGAAGVIALLFSWIQKHF